MNDALTLICYRKNQSHAKIVRFTIVISLFLLFFVVRVFYFLKYNIGIYIRCASVKTSGISTVNMACHIFWLIIFILFCADYKYQSFCNALEISQQTVDEGKS